MRDLTKTLAARSTQLTREEQSALLGRAQRELAERSKLGSFIVPLCFAMAVLCSEFPQQLPYTFLLLSLCMVGTALCRHLAIGWIKGETQVSSSGSVQLFFWACIGMATIWGITTAIFFYYNFEGFAALLILLLSAGIGAGSMVNFCIWRTLTVSYLLLSFVPVVLISFILGQVEVIPAMIAVVFFILYLLAQTGRWNQHFWDSLLTTYLFEQQADKLSKTNSRLAETLGQEKKLRQEVEKGKAKVRELFNLTSEALVVCGLDGRVLDMNQAALVIFECKRKQIIGSSVLERFLIPKENELFLADLWETAVKGQDVDFECSVQGRGEEPLLLGKVNLRRLTWQEEAIIFVTIHDITVQKKVEDALKITQKFLAESEGYLQAILSNVALPIYCKDPDGRYLTANEPFEQLCCRTLAEIQGKTDLQIFPQDLASFLRSKDAEILATGESYELEGTYRLGAQQKKIFVHKFPLKENNGTIYATAGICTDRTTMREALHAAQLASAAKSEFLAGMSHELRTPMHSILSVARLGLKRTGKGSRDKLATYFSMIITSGDQLLELLSNLLDLGTLESDRASYHLEEFDLAVDIETITREFKVMMGEREIKITFHPPADPLVALYDRTKISQVLRNLLANAMKFTGQGKEVRVVVENDYLEISGNHQPAWKVMVIDQGIGVHLNELDSVFGKFVRGSKSCAGASGVGLGLSICKRIIEHHNGLIWAQQNEVEGTTFCFLLPAAQEISKKSQ